MSEYDWFGAQRGYAFDGGTSTTTLLTGPEDTALAANVGTVGYNPDLGSVGDAEWLIRHIGEFSVRSVNAPAGDGEGLVAWALRYVPDVRVIDSNEFGNLFTPEAFSADDVITHGLFQGSIRDGQVGFRHTQAHNANEGLAGNAWDVESVKPADDTSAIALTLQSSFSVPLFATIISRTLTRG